MELYLDREAYPRVFAAGMTRSEAVAAAQRPITAVAFEEKSPAAAWKTAHSWYVIATEDQVIPAGAQRFMAERAGSRHLRAETRPAGRPRGAVPSDLRWMPGG